ncbi:DUF1056 family protein [Paucilactobacillus sp. N302-9]
MNRIRDTLKILLANSSLILLIAGVVSLTIAAFLVNKTVGFCALGVLLVILSWMTSPPSAGGDVNGS